MKTTIFGFNQLSVIQSKLQIRDLLLADFLCFFSLRDNLKRKDHEGESYFWVSYNYVADEMPILFSHIKTTNPDTLLRNKKLCLKRMILRLCKAGVLKFHLSKDSEGTFTFLRITGKLYDLKSDKTTPIKETNPSKEKKHTTKQKKTSNVKKTKQADTTNSEADKVMTLYNKTNNKNIRVYSTKTAKNIALLMKKGISFDDFEKVFSYFNSLKWGAEYEKNKTFEYITRENNFFKNLEASNTLSSINTPQPARKNELSTAWVDFYE